MPLILVTGNPPLSGSLLRINRATKVPRPKNLMAENVLPRSPTSGSLLVVGHKVESVEVKKLLANSEVGAV
jgi:hypothetical protein